MSITENYFTLDDFAWPIFEGTSPPSPPPPPLTGPLEARVLAAARTIAAEVSDPNVIDGRVYIRAQPQYSADRDGCPAVIVCPTPGRSVTSRKLLSVREVTFPVTCLLIDRQGGRPQTTPDQTPTSGVDDWRLAWTATLFEALDQGTVWPDETVNIDRDTMTQLDTAAFEQAGLWVSQCSVLVICRLAFPTP